jgi:glycosyltransferase involved in cell wall biosynthesis
LDRPGKIEFLSGLDVFSVACTYDEPKGLSLLEAMAAGVPVVQPRRGSFPEIIGRTSGGLLAATDDAAGLADAIYELWKTPALAADLGRKGSQGVRTHYKDECMATRELEVYRAVAAQQS